jgi:uncharacterized protein YbjQ (UPF0145 family)
MKNRPMLGALAAVVITQAGCATQIKSVPLQPAMQQPAAGSGVALYFGSQSHPAVQRMIGETSHSVRVARAQDDADAACDNALSQALSKLRADAQERKANAVINVQTRFHNSENKSATEYTCGVSPSAAAVAVQGDLVVLQAD